MNRFASLLLLLAALAAIPAVAHEVRPAYLEITETAPGRIDVLWKQPTRGEMAVRLSPRISGGLLDRPPVSVETAPNFRIQRWQGLPLPDGSLAGHSISVDGLDRTITDVLLVVRLQNGRTVQTLLKPAAPVYEAGTAGTGLPVAAYLRLGVDHILTGVDHLLFVFGLILLVSGWRMLLKTITAFTVAHSITLAATALGFFTVNPGLIEVLVALSILFLAVELVHKARDGQTLAVRHPWLIAFLFGLLHGTAFAGALADIGLPAHNVPLALFLFNLGVEIGQLLFVGAVLALGAAGRFLLDRLPAPPRIPAAAQSLAPAYVVGAFAAYWFFDRIHLVLA